jgi:rare lipoprotein A
MLRARRGAPPGPADRVGARRAARTGCARGHAGRALADNGGSSRTLPRVPRTAPIIAAAALVLAGCAAPPPKAPPASAPTAPAPASKPGYYLDDGPGEAVPANIDAIPDAQPKLEPLHRAANRPYTVFGREYVPATSLRPYRERGVASWYGRKFHGEKTSIGETYDMYAMTAAHPTLPLPSYARVTSIASGKSVVVRVNDRGPFLHDRVIDLSYAAAHRIGIAQKGSGEVEVEAIIPGTALFAALASPLPPVAAAPAAVPREGQPPGETGVPVPVAPSDGAFLVQLGAFANYANAQNFVARVANQLAPLGVEARIRQSGGLFRAYVGPYPTREDARRTADRLRDALGLPSTIAAH